MSKSTKMLLMRKYFDPKFGNKTIWDKIAEHEQYIIKRMVELISVTKKIQNHYRSVRFSKSENPGFKTAHEGWILGIWSRESQRCIVYSKDPTVPGKVSWKIASVKKAGHQECKYAAAVILDGKKWEDTEYYYDTKELRDIAHSKCPKLGLIVNVVLIK